MPTGVTISQTVGVLAATDNKDVPDVGNDKLFGWTIGNSPLKASFELVWRARRV
jgi:hypothetical protein